MVMKLPELSLNFQDQFKVLGTLINMRQAKATKCKPGGGQSLIVASQAAEASHPSKAALDHPPARQQYEAPLASLRLATFSLIPGR